MKPEGQEQLKQYYTDPEYILERNLARFEKTYFGGDAFPCIFSYWGTGGHAKYLKTEVIYREQRFIGFTDAERRIDSFIDFYNDKRPHSSIGMKVPSQAHQESGEQRKCW